MMVLNALTTFEVGRWAASSSLDAVVPMSSSATWPSRGGVVVAGVDDDLARDWLDAHVFV